MFWGDPELQGLHIGLFIALAALLVFWVILNRTTLGYEVRAVGFNPEAAAAVGHLGARATTSVVMAICGAVRRAWPGAIDILGWQFRLATNDIQANAARLHRHRGRAARPQHGGRHVLLARCCSAR